MSLGAGDVLVVGGGIMGSAISYYLTKQGLKVFLVERRSIGLEASGRNGGGVRQQKRGPLMMAYARESIKMWLHLQEELQFDVGYIRCGNLCLALNEEHLEEFRERVVVERSAGLKELMLLNREDVEEFIPGLSERVLGATYCPTDGMASPFHAAPAFARAAARYGAEILPRTTVQGIQRKKGRVKSVLTDRGRIEAKIVVIAAGPWSPQIAEMAGLRIPIQVMQSQILVTEKVEPFIAPFVSAPDSMGYISQRPSGNVILGYTAQPIDNKEQRVTWEGLITPAKIWGEIVPPLKQLSIIRSFAGITAFTPDGNPIIGWLDEGAGIAVTAGFNATGFALGPVMGRLMSELITWGRPSLSLHPFRIDRFSQTA